MGGWAQRAAKQAFDKDQHDAQSRELRLREERIKDGAWQSTMDALLEQFRLETKEYNDLRRKDELQVRGLVALDPNDAGHGYSINVSRIDGKKQPLKLHYSPLNHKLHHECGKGPGDFHLRVDDETNEVYFADIYRSRKTLEQITEELLQRFQDSQF